MQIIQCTINCHTKNNLWPFHVLFSTWTMPLVSCFFFYGHSMESLSHKLVSPVNDFNGTLYGHLMFLIFFHFSILWNSCFFIRALYGTHVFFSLWHPMQLLFSHNIRICNSYFSIFACYESNVCSQFHLTWWRHFFPKRKTFLYIQISCSQSGLSISSVANIPTIFCHLFFFLFDILRIFLKDLLSKRFVSGQ